MRKLKYYLNFVWKAMVLVCLPVITWNVLKIAEYIGTINGKFDVFSIIEHVINAN